MPDSPRHLEAIVSLANSDRASDILTEFGADPVWAQDLRDNYVSVRAVLESRSVEGAMDGLANLVSADPAARVILTDVQATLPRAEEALESEEPKEKEEPKFGPNRIGREELYSQIVRGGRISVVYAVLVALSSVVASIGIIRDNTGVVIGAMVIAPLLGPSVALALGATLADWNLMKRAATATGLGFLIAISVSVIVGLIVDIDLSSGELASRTDIGPAEIALALASGVAAALAFTTGASSALIGVMVSVALLPPTVALGMLTVNGEWALARGAGLLLMINLAAVNLTAVTTFAAQGIRPARWWEANKARRSTRIAVVGWGLLLVALGVAIWLGD